MGRPHTKLDWSEFHLAPPHVSGFRSACFQCCSCTDFPTILLANLSSANELLYKFMSAKGSSVLATSVTWYWMVWHRQLTMKSLKSFSVSWQFCSPIADNEHVKCVFLLLVIADQPWVKFDRRCSHSGLYGSVYPMGSSLPRSWQSAGASMRTVSLPLLWSL